jgi:hypothetical protein
MTSAAGQLPEVLEAGAAPAPRGRSAQITERIVPPSTRMVAPLT